MRYLIWRLSILAGTLALGLAALPVQVAAQVPAAVSKKSAPLKDPTKPLAAAAHREQPAPAAGTVRVNSRDGLKYVWIAPGTFRMGCSPGDNECVDAEKPAHNVMITKGFWIGQTLVTVAAYKHYTKVTGKPMAQEPDLMGRPLNPGWKNEKEPIVNVNWEESRQYCVWEGGSLPTDAQWEYAARGGNPSARYGKLDDIAWYADNSGSKRLDSTALKNEDKAKYGGGRKIFNQALHDNGNVAHDVALKAPNGYGLYDMLGNEWEWINDWYDPNYYQHSPAQDPQGPATGKLKLERAASWDDVPQYLRASFNHWTRPDLRNYTLGFRCVWNAPKP